ncbi:MAG: hypothetical protein ACTSYS_11305 [Promethearchaeota archaeon]
MVRKSILEQERLLEEIMARSLLMKDLLSKNMSRFMQDLEERLMLKKT